MALFLRNAETFSPTKTVRIVGSQMTEDHTVYVIEVNVGIYKWNVIKRYSEFYDLNEKLISLTPSLDKDLLPKKKVFGNNSESFIKKRQAQLEIYLQSLFRSFQTIPTVLLKFLDFHKYEIHAIVESLSEDYFEKGERLLALNKFSTLTTLQLNALCVRLELPEPTCGSNNLKRDLGHLLDFVTRLKLLQVLGQSLPFGASNIVANELSYHLQYFKSLESLKFSNCKMDHVRIDDNVKKQLKHLVVCKTLSALKEILMVGVDQPDCKNMSPELLDAYSWSAIKIANFSDNKIESIDDSIRLLPNMEHLSLSNNRIQQVEHLHHFSFLRSVDLSLNHISNVDLLHIKLGNVTNLNLARNRISILSGISKMYSLQKLNLSYNSILQKEELNHLHQLPNLEYLDTRKNPMTRLEDYRVDVYEMFGERAREIVLDKKSMSSRELDLVSVRLALKKSKMVKTVESSASSSSSSSRPSSSMSKDSSNKVGSPKCELNNEDDLQTIISASSPMTLSTMTIIAATTFAASLTTTISTMTLPTTLITPTSATITATSTSTKPVLKTTSAASATTTLTIITSPTTNESRTKSQETTTITIPLPPTTLTSPTSSSTSTLLSDAPSSPSAQPISTTATAATATAATATAATTTAATGTATTTMESRNNSKVVLPIVKVISEDMDEGQMHQKHIIKGCVKSTTTSQLFTFPIGHQHVTNITLLGKKSLTNRCQKKYFLLPDTLPGHNNKALITEIESLLSYAFQCGVCDVDLKRESPMHIMWCSAYANLTNFLGTDPDCPCCVYVTPYNIHVFKVDELKGDTGVPTMRYFTSISFTNLRCILVGCQSLYIRLVICDEFQVDIVFLTFSSSKTDMFLTHIKRACRRGVPNLDDYEDPLIYHLSDECEQLIFKMVEPYEMGLSASLDSNVNTDLEKAVINCENSESHNSFISPGDITKNVFPNKKIKFYCLVQLIRDFENQERGKTSALIATSKNLYIIHQNFSCFPSFTLEPEHHRVNYTHSMHSVSDNTVACIFPLNSRIVNLQMYDANILEGSSKIEINKNKPSFDYITNHDFIGYGLKITFHLGIYGVQTLNIRWPSSNMRDSFLNWFTKIRNEIKESNSSSSFPLSSRKFRKKKRVGSEEWENRHQEFDDEDTSLREKFPFALVVHSDDDALEQKDSYKFRKSYMLNGSADCSPVIKTNINSTEQTSPGCVIPSEIIDKQISPGLSTSDYRVTTLHNEDKFENHGKSASSTQSKLLSEGFNENFNTAQLVSISKEQERLYCINSPRNDGGENSISNSDLEIECSYPKLENVKLILSPGKVVLTLKELGILDLRDNKIVLDIPSSNWISDDAKSRMKCCMQDIYQIFNQFDVCFPTEEALINFYRKYVAQKGEIVHFFLFTNVILHTNPSQEIPSCVILTNRCIYFTSNSHLTSSSFKTFYSLERECCFLYCDKSKKEIKSAHLEDLKIYLKISLEQLHEVNLGMFGEFFRFLVHNDRNSIACCITRDNRLSQLFLHQLLECLSKIRPILPPEPAHDLYETATSAGKGRVNPDHYTIFRHSMTGSYNDVCVYYNVNFIYPSDETLTDISYTMNDKVPPIPCNLKIFFYLACHLIPDNIDHKSKNLPLNPVNLLVTENSVAIIEEDYVSYPLPDFLKFPPDKPQLKLLSVHPLKKVLKVALINECFNILRIFVSEGEEKEEIMVDMDLEHFGGEISGVSTHKIVTENRSIQRFFTFFIKSRRDVDLFINVISKRWALCNDNEISVIYMPLFASDD